MSAIADKKLKEIINFYIDKGELVTQEAYSLTAETFNRYKRLARKQGILTKRLESLIQVAEKLTDKELKNMLSVQNNELYKPVIHSFKGETTKFMALSDLHLGSKFTNDDYILEALELAEKEKCEFITMGGDIVEGMSGRPGHVYELTHIGYDAQKTHAIEILSQSKLPMYMIDGNHDRWFIKSNGAIIVKDICRELKNATFLGHDEGDIALNNCIIRLWHGEDASSYATSYRIQKIVESLSGGDKPAVLLAAHTHKSIYCFERNVHCFSTGAIQRQSKWMRSKRMSSHTGFWIIELTTNSKTHGIGKTTSTWYPFYV